LFIHAYAVVFPGEVYYQGVERRGHFVQPLLVAFFYKCLAHDEFCYKGYTICSKCSKHQSMNKWLISLSAAAFFTAACGNSGDAEGDASRDKDTATAAPDTIAKSENAALELVFADSTYQLTGVAKHLGQPLLVNYPRWSDVYRYAVVEASGDSGLMPYPDSSMNQWKPGQPARNKWVCVQSVYADDSGYVWVLDPAAPKLKNIVGGGAKLVRMNRETKKPERTYSFTGIVPDTAYVNDVRIDVPRQFAYITESKGGGIIVVDLRSGKMRRVLAGHYSTKSDPAFKFIIDGQELMKDGKPVKINSDGIALTPDGNWLYYKPLTDDKLYRVPTEVLRDWKAKDTAISNKVEDLGHFNTTDGMIFDKTGNLYMGDLQHYSIVVLSRDHKKTVLTQSPQLIWPDSYAISDGYLYITCSQIQKQPEFNNGQDKRTSPYTVYRVRLAD
jgi:sugar lactone lactonase YvrE